MLKRFEGFKKEAQKYKKILIDYKNKGKVFTDPNFHPKAKIPESQIKFESRVKWVRVDDINQAPLFDPELIKPEFIQQGEIGNCSFVSALMQLSTQPHLIPYLFSHQSDSVFGKEKDSINLKCGAVVVYFHAFSQKTPVLIDTQIACIGKTTPLFTHLKEKEKSLWFCLVEKAYAKLCGSYSEIVSVDFISPIYSLYGYYGLGIRHVNGLRNKKKNRTEFESLLNFKKKNALIKASIQSYENSPNEKELSNVGLQFKHSYFVVDVKKYKGKNFIKLRNPYGNESWKGDYCNDSKFWTPEVKKAFNYDVKNESGSFWMIESDFLKYFNEIDIAKPIKKKWYKRHITCQIPKDPKDDFPRICYEIADNMPDNEVSMHIIAERIRPLVDENKKLTPEPPAFAIPEISYYLAPFRILCACDHLKKGDKKRLLVSHGNNPYTEIETVFLTFYCEYDFKLYEKSTPDKLIPTDKNDGLFFHLDEIIIGAESVENNQDEAVKVEPEPDLSELKQNDSKSLVIEQIEPDFSELKQNDSKSLEIKQIEPAFSELKQNDSKSLEIKQIEPDFSELKQNDSKPSEPKATQTINNNNIIIIDPNDDGESYYNQAILYKENENIPNHMEESAKYMKLSADKGYKKAIFLYGYYLQFGLGVQEDAQESLRYYKTGADLGDEKCAENYQILKEKVLGSNEASPSKCCLLI